MDHVAVITIDKLSKRYDGSKKFALKDLSISVKKGEVFGFLGPNGAGKSTTIRMLLNVIQPTSGSAQIDNNDVVIDNVEVKKRIGYLSGDFRAYEKMTCGQFFSYMQSLQPPKRKTYVDELCKIFKIGQNKRIGDLSKGNKQKIGIIQAFMHEPDILILDEPTDGLDPLMQQSFYDLVHKTKKNGVTFFISSHNLAEVRKICDRVAIIKDGKLVSQSRISDLTAEAAHTFIINFEGKLPGSELNKIKGVKAIPVDENTLQVHVHGNLGPFLREIAKYNVARLATQELSLEDEFMRFYKTKESR